MTSTIEELVAMQARIAVLLPPTIQLILELEALAKSLKQPSKQLVIEGRTLDLKPGERYTGAKLDKEGNHLHDVVVMAERLGAKQDFDTCKKWGENLGCSVASPEDYALIKANCSDLLTEPWYWTNKPYTNNVSYAWYFTSDGLTSNGYRSDVGSALAVRRI